MKLAWVGVVLLLASCTSPNPRSCADGTCTEPSLPFCDTDGAISGTAGTCVSVDCTPNTFELCRGDIAVTCNAQGTDYDLIQCERGCGDTGCNSCTTDIQCSNPSPVCEPTSHTCRACAVDAECASKVCDIDSGACLAESSVVYASPTGASSGVCSQASPCSLLQAVSVATANSLRSTIRMATGIYDQTPKLSAGSITLIGAGATLIGDNGGSVMSVGRNASVVVRALQIELARGPVFCGGDGSSGPFVLGGTLTMRDVTVVASMANAVQLVGCTASVRGSTFQVAASNVDTIVAVGDDSSFDVDQSRFASTTADTGFVQARGHRMTLRIFNSVFDHISLVVDPLDASPTATHLTFAFNTHSVTTGGLGVSSSNGTLTGIVENNILVTGGTSAYSCTACTANHNVMFPQPAAPVGNVVLDPQFVDATARNYHLKMTSPARDMAVPSTGLSTDHDYDGTMRPQGTAPDLGAFEYKP